VASLGITAKIDLPIGAAIVCVLGGMLILAATVSKLRRSLAHKAH
jgi:hypothetical protein